jgi:hypothetical protein
VTGSKTKMQASLIKGRTIAQLIKDFSMRTGKRR